MNTISVKMSKWIALMCLGLLAAIYQTAMSQSTIPATKVIKVEKEYGEPLPFEPTPQGSPWFFYNYTHFDENGKLAFKREKIFYEYKNACADCEGRTLSYPHVQHPRVLRTRTNGPWSKRKMPDIIIGLDDEGNKAWCYALPAKTVHPAALPATENGIVIQTSAEPPEIIVVDPATGKVVAERALDIAGITIDDWEIHDYNPKTQCLYLTNKRVYNEPESRIIEWSLKTGKTRSIDVKRKKVFDRVRPQIQTLRVDAARQCLYLFIDWSNMRRPPINQNAFLIIDLATETIIYDDEFDGDGEGDDIIVTPEKIGLRYNAPGNKHSWVFKTYHLNPIAE